MLFRSAWVFDTRHVISPEIVEESKLNVWQLGNGSNDLNNKTKLSL